MVQYIDKAAVVAEIEKRTKMLDLDNPLGRGGMVELLFLKDKIDTIEVKEVNKKSETANRSKIIKVKCISPFDETWEKGKVYTGEKWHHGDLNMDFWDIYYDYGSNPKYVQFSSFEMLEKEFVVLKNDTLEVEEVDLDFQRFAKEMKSVFSLPSPKTENIEEEPLNWEYAIAKHFYSLGFKAQKGEMTMATITEDYVSFETAKLLKEKGFDEKCLCYYEDNTSYNEGIKFSDWFGKKYSNSEIGRRFAVPTLQMAMKWLREKHLLHIPIDMMNGGRWKYEIDDISVPFDGGILPKYYCDKTFSIYEEAVEDAIKYCLENLI